jgi:hypothetical protein
VAQDFWASSGYALLAKREEGLVATDAWLARFLARDELRPPLEAGPRERALHARLSSDPRASVAAAERDAVEDADARENWSHFLRFRDRLLAHPTIEAAYVDLFREDVDVAPFFVDALVEVITRAMLDGLDDAWLARAGEMLFRRQRVSTEGGQALAVDAATLEMHVETGEVKMDVLSRENAPFYWMRDELHSFALDITPGAEGAAALARVLERWVARLAGVRVAIEPVARVDDARWRWHIGLDLHSTAILNALYRGETIPGEDLERLVLLMRLTFVEAADALPPIQGRPVYLGVATSPERTLKLKPQNVLLNLPLARPS